MGRLTGTKTRMWWGCFLANGEVLGEGGSSNCCLDKWSANVVVAFDVNKDRAFINEVEEDSVMEMMHGLLIPNPLEELESM